MCAHTHCSPSNRQQHKHTWPSTLLRAQTTTTSAHVPLPIQRFWPSRTQPPVTYEQQQQQQEQQQQQQQQVSTE
jgi:hypothetical protein